jgi:X-Pro dipeptidyl-peptidase
MRRALPTVVGLALLGAPVVATAGPPYTQFAYERIKVPMRDGVLLSADLYRPVTGGVPVPVLISMTPYHALYKALDRNESDLTTAAGWAELFVLKAGYAFAQVDVRGTYNSGGCWDYGGINERRDGFDTVEWFGGVLADGVTPSPAATWSNGRVGMIGASYDGTTANAAAVEQPPHLATIVPVSAISRWWGYAYQQGARSLYSGESADIDPPSDTPTDFMLVYCNVPPPDPAGLNDPQQLAMRWNLCARVEQTLHGYDTQPDYDEFWRERDYLARADLVRVPVLVAHGFLDFNVKTWEGIAWFQALDTEKMLVAGQWPHALPSCCKWLTILRRWLDRWLYDVPNGIENEPAVRVVSNAGERTQETWGDAAIVNVPLASGAPSYFDDGLLTESEMLRGLSPSRYVRVALPGASGIHIEGRPVLHLVASSDRTSTHFVAVLCDVASPGGACKVISRAFLNARYADGFEQGVDLTPGQRRRFDLEFIDKDYVVPAGSHLEMIIASSSNTWIVPDEQRATNTLYLNESSIDLPLR